MPSETECNNFVSTLFSDQRIEATTRGDFSWVSLRLKRISPRNRIRVRSSLFVFLLLSARVLLLFLRGFLSGPGKILLDYLVFRVQLCGF